MDRDSIFEAIKGGLIVSCQALPEEPLYSSTMMAMMAVAAAEGGAVGIRCNSAPDIRAIAGAVNLPLIGIVKRDYEDSPIYITPTALEIDEVAQAGAHILAMDATRRHRPGGVKLKRLVDYARHTYPELLLMADCSNFSDAQRASELGFDFVGTTLSGYTEDTQDADLPNIDLMCQIAQELHIPLIAEGGIWMPEQLRSAMDAGAHAAVVGTAITRPRDITKRFVQALPTQGEESFIQ